MDTPETRDTFPEDPVLAAARSRFGIRYLYPYQRLVVANVLDAMELDSSREEEEEKPDPLRQLVLLPTGYGKSLCFQLPSLFMRGITLVVYPLRSLMADQARRLRQRGLACVVLQGGMTPAARGAAFEELQSGNVRMVLANPEILRSESVLSFLRSRPVSHAVIDEAHCVAEWGSDFRPSYADLGDILTALSPQAITAFTATASPGIQARISEILFRDTPYRTVSKDPDRPNIHYSCIPTLSKNHTLENLSLRLPRPILVFCSSRSGTQITAENLRERLGTRDVRFYHAGMTKEERSKVETWFLGSSTGILTATCAFGMGIDKPDIRSVIHADLPPSAESYLQESGRAGRDGKPSRAILLTHPQDDTRAQVTRDPLQAARRGSLLAYARDQTTCRREGLLRLMGVSGVPCSGCDVCDGTALSEPEGRSDSLAFASANSGRYTLAEAARILAGRSEPAAKGGALAEWDWTDVRELLIALERKGDIVIPKRGAWKGRLKRARSPNVRIQDRLSSPSS